MTADRKRFVIHDLVLVALSVAIAIVLVKTGALSQLLAATHDFAFLGTFIAGIFFTSVITTAPAIAALSQLAHTGGIPETALVGALGAVVGDLVIFLFVKKKFSVHFWHIVKIPGAHRRLRTIISMRLLRWLTFLVGGLIIASPLPDELGIGLLGFSKLKTSGFVIISFIFNFIGILLIGLIATSL